MITNFLLALAAYWIIVSLVGYRTIKKYFIRARLFQSKQIQERFQPFVRKPITEENQKTIIRGCFTRFPLHFYLMTSYLFSLAALCIVHHYLKFPKFLVQLFREHAGRLVLNICIKIQETFDPYKRISTAIIISNHVSVFEIVYFGAYPQIVSFVGKAELRKSPIVNPLMQHCHCLYVNRQSAENRGETLAKIKERVEQFSRNEIKYPLVIFPEGTVSNGKSLLQFKNGAFDSLSPITIFSFNFQDPSFDPNIADLKQLEFYFIFLMLRPKLTIKQDTITPKDNETVPEYRERCKKRMSEMGGFKSTESTFNDMKDYLNYVMDSPQGFKLLL